MKKKIPLLHFIFILSFILFYQLSSGQTYNLDVSKKRGKTIYIQRCLSCHQQDGNGVPRMNPPLNGATTVVGKNKVRLIKIILEGMTNREEIDGEYYKNDMASHADLSDQQVADVLNYIRNSWSNKAGVVTPTEVKTVRSKFK